MDGMRTLLAQAGGAADRASALAGILFDLADAVRALAARVRATEATPWRSVAADAFREGTAALAAGLIRAADDLDGAGRALRAHAAAAATGMEVLARLAGTVERLLGDGVDDLARSAEDSLHRALPPAWRLP